MCTKLALVQLNSFAHKHKSSHWCGIPVEADATYLASHKKNWEKSSIHKNPRSRQDTAANTHIPTHPNSNPFNLNWDECALSRMQIEDSVLRSKVHLHTWMHHRNLLFSNGKILPRSRRHLQSESLRKPFDSILIFCAEMFFCILVCQFATIKFASLLMSDVTVEVKRCKQNLYGTPINNRDFRLRIPNRKIQCAFCS